MWVQSEGRSSYFSGMIKGRCCGNLQARFYSFAFLLEFITVNMPVAFLSFMPLPSTKSLVLAELNDFWEEH